MSGDAEAWLAAADDRPGSWWNDWAAWLKPFAGESRAPRRPGNDRYRPIEPAPGHFVRERAV